MNRARNDDQAGGAASPPRYHSPLRAAQVAATRELIVRAAAALLGAAPFEEPSVTLVARAAGIRERTLYRHFATRDDLLKAAWARVAEQHWLRRDAVEASSPRTAFGLMDEHEGLTVAALSSAHGRSARRQAAAIAKGVVASQLAHETAGLPAGRRQEVEAVFRLLGGAWAWMGLREEGLTGAQAADAAAWALGALVEALRRERLATVRGFPQGPAKPPGQPIVPPKGMAARVGQRATVD